MKLMFLVAVLLLSVAAIADEQAPQPEYPQPMEREISSETNSLGVEKHIRADKRGGYYYDTKKKNKSKKPFPGVQQPYKIDSDGAYYYSDEKKKDANIYEGVEQPIDSDSDGAYYYKRKKRKPKIPKTIYGEKPAKIEADGSYIYDREMDETRNTFYFRAGVYGPPEIQPVTAGGRDYEEVYGDSSSFVFNVEYDWLLTSNLFLKFGFGLTSVEGQGQFAGGANPGVEPRENFTFFIVPTTLSAAYKFQLWDIQYLTPYVEGGAGYFGFVETRSDGDKTKFGGAPVLVAAGGLLVSMSKFMQGTSLSTEYGVTQMWLDFQFKQILGLDSRKDFTSNMITGGFAVGF